MSGLLHAILVILAIAVGGGAVYVYFTYIRNKMVETAAVTGKAATVAATPAPAKILAILQGWKTHILVLVGVVTNGLAALPHLLAYFNAELLAQWQALPWSSIVDAHVAAWINFAILALIPLTHSQGVNQAAKTPPQGQ
ncbi:membrane hypothetical protein [Methylocella tundrae]|uniref:Uncharacterized protein n=1 Tax=Methylocella tundrae TaxID=227605 RepID=A0A8B6MD51_METTU|nr:hypothetical protein [Methylocella tundrae]VTZ24346.1 membrane hypothetical protein [Methylocella tundrae]VTZ52459.1 membrane hypothetical protein [Methylocella tundrae]